VLQDATIASKYDMSFEVLLLEEGNMEALEPPGETMGVFRSL